jgi:5-formyltetrahydrofolate cyclo-ligase
VLELPQYLAAQSIACYCAIGNEVETWAIMNHALSQKKKVFCPKTSEPAPLLVRIFSETDLAPGPLGAAEPQGHTLLGSQDCASTMVLVPGVVFDVYGNRLGRGGGWYDRALQWFENRGVFVGLAYDLQVVDRLPDAPWDMKVHYVVTESRVMDCGVAPREQIAR